MFGVSKGFTRSAIRREPRTSKTLPSGWVKGKGVWSIGHVDPKGRFQVDSKKLYTFDVPDLSNFELKPYVSHLKSPKPKQ